MIKKIHSLPLSLFHNFWILKFSVVLYRKTLQIAKLLGDKALEAQACYSLGNTYTLLRDYEKAIEYHMRHLQIAQELSDRVGEGRACWSLGNAHTALGNHEDAMQFANQHLQISKEVCSRINNFLEHFCTIFLLNSAWVHKRRKKIISVLFYSATCFTIEALYSHV